MPDPRTPDQRVRNEEFARRAAKKAERRRRAAGQQPRVLAWLGAFGTVGWSIAVPTVAGVLLGRWVDDAFGGGTVSWTLTFLLVGVAIGAALAWSWVRREGGRHD